MKILFLGDIMGRPGRKRVRERIRSLRDELGVDAVLANGENASAGKGLSAKNAKELLNCGIDAMSSGNHIWKFKDIRTVLDDEPRLLRPLNYPPKAPGRGVGVYEIGGVKVALINVQGRTFMEPIDCPFRAVDEALAELPEDVTVRIVDIHAEATSEKIALGWFLDGRVSVVLGTHTHVQTNDARVLPKGTAFLTDLGMCGPRDSCLGMRKGPVLQKFLTGLPTNFDVAGGATVLQGAVFDIDETTGLARSITLHNETDES